jgi:AcrR family transcriptional regulator
MVEEMTEKSVGYRARRSKRMPAKLIAKTGPPGIAGRTARWIAKPKTKSSERRRNKIFESAIAAGNEIARSEGLGGLTARRIARNIGCSVGTLYNVFDSLDTLIIHVNGATFDALYEELNNIEASNDGETTVNRVVDTYLNFVRENPNSWSVVFDHVWPQSYPLPQWYIDKIRRLLVPLAEALAPLFPSGQEDKIGQAAILLWSGLHGIQSLSSDAKLGFITSETAHDLSNAMVGTIIAGIRDQTGKSGPD